MKKPVLNIYAVQHDNEILNIALDPVIVDKFVPVCDILPSKQFATKTIRDGNAEHLMRYPTDTKTGLPLLNVFMIYDHNKVVEITTYLYIQQNFKVKIHHIDKNTELLLNPELEGGTHEHLTYYRYENMVRNHRLIEVYKGGAVNGAHHETGSV